MSSSLSRSHFSSLLAISANCCGFVVFSFSVHSKTLSMVILSSARLKAFNSSKRVLEEGKKDCYMKSTLPLNHTTLENFWKACSPKLLLLNHQVSDCPWMNNVLWTLPSGITKSSLKIVTFRQDHFILCFSFKISQKINCLHETNSVKNINFCAPCWGWKALNDCAETYRHLTTIQRKSTELQEESI